MLQALIQTAACAVLLKQGRLNGFHRKQAQTLHKLLGFQALGFQQCAGLSLEGLIYFHGCMAELSNELTLEPTVLLEVWNQKVIPR